MEKTITYIIKITSTIHGANWPYKKTLSWSKRSFLGILFVHARCVGVVLRFVLFITSSYCGYVVDVIRDELCASLWM